PVRVVPGEDRPHLRAPAIGLVRRWQLGELEVHAEPPVRIPCGWGHELERILAPAKPTVPSSARTAAWRYPAARRSRTGSPVVDAQPPRGPRARVRAPVLGPRVLGLARQPVGLAGRPLVHHARLPRLDLDRAPVGVGRPAVGLAGRLLGALE